MSYYSVFLMCSVAMSWLPDYKQTDEKMDTCMALGTQAVIEDVPLDLAIALAFTESRFSRTARSSVGASGPFQVVPRYHCPNKRLEGCDLITAGLRAIKRYRKRYKRWRDALCHWNSGNRCYRKSRLFARIVLRRKRLLNRSLGDHHAHEEGYCQEGSSEEGSRGEGPGTGEEGNRTSAQAR